MSFISHKTDSTVYLAGYFLAHEECERVTKQVPQSMATTAADGSKYVKAGTVFPANDATAVGIIYEDVDVTTGAMPASVVIKGSVIEDRLPQTVASAAKSAMTGITFR